MYTLVLSGPTYYQNKIQNLNIAIENQKISKLSKSKLKSEATIKTKDLILPGLIDPHVHFREPGNKHKETFRTGTCAAAAGGITTALDMPNNYRHITTKKLLQEKEKIVSKKAVIDYGLYLQAGIPSEADTPLMKYFLGFGSFDDYEKCYSKSTGVNVFHAEDPELFQEVENPTIYDHNTIHPPEAAEAACKFINSLYSKYQKPTHITHITTRQEVHTILPNITKGVTPPHLFLSIKNLDVLGTFGKVDPPLREEADRIYLLTHLDKIDCVGTDHAPHTPEEKEADYPAAKSGLPGIEDYISLLFTELHKGNLDLSTIVRLTHAGPAKIFGLKRGIATGNDADFTIIDRKKERIINVQDHFSKCGWTPYDGWKVRGEIQKTLVRGKTVFEKEVGILTRKWGKNLFKIDGK